MSVGYWIAAIWLASAACVAIFARASYGPGGGIWEPDRRARSVALCLALFALAPLLAPAILWRDGRKLWRWAAWRALPGAADPELADRSATFRSRDDLLATLVRRRRRFDPRLRGERVENWPMFRLARTPEAKLLELAEAHRDLVSGGAADWQIWEKLDVWLDADGPPMPVGSTLRQYVGSRAGHIDPELPGLGDAFLSGHLDICLRWLDGTGSRIARDWPPATWLTKRLTLASLDDPEIDLGGSVESAPAILHLGLSRRDIEWFKLKILADDELWAFVSPPESWERLGGRAGLALVREGRCVAHVVVAKN